MTTARTVAPNHGGRANTLSRAVVASFAPIAQRIEQRSSNPPVAGSSPAGGASFKRCDVAWPQGTGKRAGTFPKKGSIPSHGATFNADRLPSLGGLKHETNPASQSPDVAAQFAHQRAKGLQRNGGRRLFTTHQSSRAEGEFVPVDAGAFYSLVHAADFLRLPIYESIRTCRKASYAI